jgi:NADPH:quinone reductase-like Zn-dependent oxidoreductase
MRAGWWPEGKPAFPLVLGTDGSGTVVTAGSSVRRYGVEPEPNQRSGIELISYDAVSGVPEFERLGEAIEQSKRVVPIAAEYPLAEAKAHERLAAGHVLGKIVLRVQPA